MSNVLKPPPDGNRGEGKDTVHVHRCVHVCVCVQVNVCATEIRGITPVWYRLVPSRAGVARAVGLRAMRGHSGCGPSLSLLSTAGQHRWELVHVP